MKYDEKLRELISRLRNVSGLTIDIVEYEDEVGPFYGLRFYSEQFLNYTEEQRIAAAEYLVNVRKLMTEYGLLVTLEPVEGEP